MDALYAERDLCQGHSELWTGLYGAGQGEPA